MDGTDEDRIRELENNQESAYKAELAELYLAIEGHVDKSEPRPDDMPRDEYIVNVIEREIEEKDLVPVVNEMEQLGDAEEVWDEHRAKYKNCYKKFGTSAGLLLALGVAVVAIAISASGTFSAGAIVIYAVMAFFSVNFAWDGISYFNEARELKEEFEEKWRDYKAK